MPASFSERQARAEERSARGRAAGKMSAARDPDRAQSLRTARWNHFLAEARKLHPGTDEGTAAGSQFIIKIATLLEQARMAELSAKALKARRELKEARERDEAAQADLTDESLPDAG